MERKPHFPSRAAPATAGYRPPMRHGITLPPFLDWSDPRVVAALAAEAEAAGWDGFFLWDHIAWDPAWGGPLPMADPWQCLTAAAIATDRLRLGPMVTPLTRRRPQQVARQVVTLDLLSRGRVVLGVGLGADYEFVAFGEPVRDRGRRLDEALTVITGLLAGDAVDFEGDHFTVHCAPMLPTPVQEHLPIWVGGWWPNHAPFLRAARFDGVVPGKVGQDALTVDDLGAIRALVGRGEGYDYVASGTTTGPDDDTPTAWAAAGATWWLESLHPFGGNAGAARRRIGAGPPR